MAKTVVMKKDGALSQSTLFLSFICLCFRTLCLYEYCHFHISSCALSVLFLLLFFKISFLSSLLVLSVSYSISPFTSPFTLVYLSLSILFPHTFSGCPAASTGASVDVLTTNLNSRRQEKSSVLFTTRGSLYNITEFLIVNVPPKT